MLTIRYVYMIPYHDLKVSLVVFECLCIYLHVYVCMWICNCMHYVFLCMHMYVYI